MFILAVVLFAKFEKHKKNVGTLYVEIDDMYKANAIIDKFSDIIVTHFSYQIIAPKSAKVGNLGIELMVEKLNDTEIEEIKTLENVVFAVVE